MRTRVIFSGLLIMMVFLPVPQLTAKNLFSKYYRDQETRSIVIEARKYSGPLTEGKVFLTEREAIEMALVNNLDVNVERHSRLSSIWDIKSQESYYDPKGIFSYDFNRRTNPTTSVLEGGDSVTDKLSGYSFGFQQPFSTGTRLDLSFIGNRTETTSFFAGLVPAIRTEMHFLVRQDLLRGFGKTNAEYEIGISRNELDISNQEFKRQLTDIIVQVQDRFWELKAALQAVDVSRKAFEYAQTVYTQNQVRFEVGSASRLEVVQAEAEAASRKEQLVSAQFTARRVQDQLVRLITDFEDPREFTGEVIPTEAGGRPEPVKRSFDDLRAIASEMRPESQRADLNIDNFKIRYDQSRDNLKPTLELVGGYEQYGLGGTEIVRDFSQGFVNPPVLAVLPGGLGDSFGQLFSGDFKGFVVGLSLDLPIGNVASKARNAQAKIDLRRAELQKRSVRQLIASEIRDALTQIEMNQARLEAADVAVRAAGERLEAEEARFEVGLGTTRELIEAQRDQLQAILVQVRAEMDLRKSHAQLDKAVGRTFERHKIVLQDALETNVKVLHP